ncbi:hypothetical protein NL676_019083 [Syzygium grande]|nr:hypothetical protein NL676_019083 [Syzygium grande]
MPVPFAVCNRRSEAFSVTDPVLESHHTRSDVEEAMPLTVWGDTRALHANKSSRKFDYWVSQERIKRDRSEALNVTELMLKSHHTRSNVEDAASLNPHGDPAPRVRINRVESSNTGFNRKEPHHIRSNAEEAIPLNSTERFVRLACESVEL